MIEDMMKFFEKAHKHVIDEGFQWEIDLVENRHFVDIDSWKFFEEFLFVALGSSGLNNKVVKKYHDLFARVCEQQGEEKAFETIPNKRIREAVRNIWSNRDNIVKALKMKNDDATRIEYIRTLPQMGSKTAYHLARNIGIDCVKPDLWMLRLAEKYGYFTSENHDPDPHVMCTEIRNYLPLWHVPYYRIGTIDVILWRYCVLTGGIT
jgi:hypothetical protein